MTYDFGLVLEGGGMRGIFTAGVCDALLDYGVEFPYIIGTSAGASNGCVLLSRQRGRIRFIDIDLQSVRPYVGLRSVVRRQGVIDLSFIFDDVQESYFPFDFETYSRSSSRLVMVSTSAATGEAVYTEEKRDFRRFVDANRASCALPILCPPWHIDGRPMVDGGVADSIPFARALSDGCRRVVVVLTKDAAYRKSEARMWLPRRVYRDSPRLREALLSRGRRYNGQLDELADLESRGVAKVVRPADLHGVGRTTRDAEAQEALYTEGLIEGRKLAQWIERERH